MKNFVLSALLSIALIVGAVQPAYAECAPVTRCETHYIWEMFGGVFPVIVGWYTVCEEVYPDRAPNGSCPDQ